MKKDKRVERTQVCVSLGHLEPMISEFPSKLSPAVIHVVRTLGPLLSGAELCPRDKPFRNFLFPVFIAGFLPCPRTSHCCRPPNVQPCHRLIKKPQPSPGRREPEAQQTIWRGGRAGSWPERRRGRARAAGSSAREDAVELQSRKQASPGLSPRVGS